MREIIKRWYAGKYIPPENPPDSSLIFLMGHYDRHWSSRLTHTLVEFYFEHWKWLLPFLVALSALLLKIF